MAPAGAAIHVVNFLNEDGTVYQYSYDYAIYTYGTKRLRATRDKTKGIFNEFKHFLEKDGSECCKKYFLK